MFECVHVHMYVRAYGKVGSKLRNRKLYSPHNQVRHLFIRTIFMHFFTIHIVD